MAITTSRGAKRCLKAVKFVSSQPATRQLASLLFEFMTPGQRHPNFAKAQDRPFYKKDKYKSGVVFVQKFQKAYESPDFVEYVRHGGYILEDKKDELTQLDPDDVHFDLIMSEFRRCAAIIDYFYIGNTASWFGNIKHLKVAKHWLLADDAVRRRSVLEADEYMETCPFTKMYVKSLGQDYQLRLQKKVKHLGWLCEQPFLHKDKYFQKTKLNFNLARRDSKYVALLFGLQLRLQSKALERFEEAGDVDDPEFAGGRKSKKKKKELRLKQKQELAKLTSEASSSSVA